MNEIQLRPSYWANVSGGKDSLFMLDLLLNNRNKYPLDGVVHFELETDYPFIRNVVDIMEWACKEVGVKFVRIKPSVNWMELYNKYGYPSIRSRWCNSEYKLNASKQLEKFLRSQGCYVVHYIGYCFDERKRYEKRKENGITEVYPLVDFEICEDFVLEWAKKQSIFNDYYKYNRRCGCMCCPMSSKTELAYLLKYYPNEYEKYMELAKNSEKERNYLVFCGDKRYNAEYQDMIVKTKWLPRLEILIQNLVIAPNYD